MPLCLGISLLMSCFLPATAADAKLKRYEYSADAMGGAFSIVLYSTGQKRADAAAATAFAELHRLDDMLSNYRPESDWSRVNRFAAQRAVQVPQDLFDLLSACLEYSRRSEGAFDITVGPLMKAWRFYGGFGELAEDPMVREALGRVGYSNIELDAAGRTVRFARAGVEIDPGGIGKGYAVDRMIEALRRKGVGRVLVSAAGSSIYALGTPPGQPGWRVVIGGPDKSDRNADELLLRNESLSTSGSSWKSFRAHGRVYGHILDPRTGYPSQGAILVAVRAPRALDSEAWTKAFYVNGRLWSARHVPAGFRVFFCEEEDGHPRCAWLP